MNDIVREQVARQCAHFTGILCKQCRAGVEYNVLVKTAPEFTLRLPCVEREEYELAERQVRQTFCEHRRAPTEDEVETEMLKKADLANRLHDKILAGRRVGLYQVPGQILSSRITPLPHEA